MAVRRVSNGGSRAPAGVSRRATLLVMSLVAVSTILPAIAAEPARLSPAPGRPLPSAPRTRSSGPKVDPAVVPAGAVQSQPRCGHGPRVPCPRCMPSEGLAQATGNGAGACQNGPCSAACPVRPEVFGFYGTAWRRWPGTGVTPVANEEAATPARPPRIEVPAVDEESPTTDTAVPTDELPADGR